MDKVKELSNLIKKSNYIVLFTGAGFSVASGIPDFRSASGIYNEKYKTYLKPEIILSHSFFVNNLKDFYAFYKEKLIYPSALPSPAHSYFSGLEKKGKLKAVVTQNIDGLHQMAGSKNVYELHGSVKRNYCLKCHKFYSVEKILESDIPYCECGGLIKPDVVLYEESLDMDVLEGAIKEISKADLLIVAGTSLVVNPAASLINYFCGSNLVLINKSKTPYDNIANLVINEDIVKVVEELKNDDRNDKTE